MRRRTAARVRKLRPQFKVIFGLSGIRVEIIRHEMDPELYGEWTEWISAVGVIWEGFRRGRWRSWGIERGGPATLRDAFGVPYIFQDASVDCDLGPVRVYHERHHKLELR
jgi:hypothetical protein